MYTNERVPSRIGLTVGAEQYSMRMRRRDTFRSVHVSQARTNLCALCSTSGRTALGERDHLLVDKHFRSNC
jgi:hypothetical protein